MASKGAFRFGTDLWDPSYRFETSWIISPWILFACRALISLYIFTTLIFIIGYTCVETTCETVRQSFSYFTVITFWGLGFYFLVAAIHTGTYAFHGRPLLDSFPRSLQALHSLFYTTVVTFPFLVTIVYWAVLFEGPWYEVEFDAWHNVSQHGLNSAFALFEVLVARTGPMPWIHLVWLILILLGYLAVAYITWAAQGWYTYSFLNPAIHGRGYVAAYIIGIAVGIGLVFLVVYGIVWLRRWVTEEKLGMEGRFAREPSRSDVEMNIVGNKVTQ